jgi:hypothetical protein
VLDILSNPERMVWFGMEKWNKNQNDDLFECQLSAARTSISSTVKL